MSEVFDEDHTSSHDTPPMPVGGSDVKKGKKRVGWHSHNSSRGQLGDEEVVLTDLPVAGSRQSPRHRTPKGAPDADELTIALTRILSNEQEQTLRAHQDVKQSRSPESLTPPPPRVPRPVLKRDISYDGPQDREAADAMEKSLSSRQVSALNDARFRADRLARSVGRYSHSAPGSRRNSNELLPAFHTTQNDSDWRDGRVVEEDVDDDTTAELSRQGSRRPLFFEETDDEDELDGGEPEEYHHFPTGATPFTNTNTTSSQPRHRFPSRRHDYDSSPSDDDQEVHVDQALAERIVRRFHSKKGRKNLYTDKHSTSSWIPSPSGTSTPQQQFDDEADYVPRPVQFRGGILASLLKLQQRSDRRGSGGDDNSGYSTPTAASTPVMSPRSSPPSSRSSSPAPTKSSHGHGLRASLSLSRSRHGSSSLSRPGSGLFYHHQRSANSASSVTLTELMKSSSSMFTAHASGEVSEKVSDKIRRENRTNHPNKPPSKKDQIRITVHIAGIIARHRYLMKLCRALMMYGAPTHRLEEYMIMSSRVLEIEGQFLYIPSCMIISFDDSSTHTTEVKVVRVPQGIDLGKLRDVHDIYKDVVHDKLGVEEATRRLDEVMKRKEKFSTWFRVLMYGVASASVAPFAFQGRWIDLPIAFFLGCLLGVMQLVFAPSNELYAHVFEVSAAVITSFLARGFGSIRNGELFCFSALAQSSIALILPGYIVLCSSLELQSHNIVAGSVRMVYAMIYTLFLGYGITIGASLYGMFDRNATSATHCDAPLDRGWYLLFVPAFTLCLCIINQAKWSQTPTMLLMALAGFCVNSYSSQYFEGNSQISNMLGALTVGILANLYSRLGRHFENFRLDCVEYWETKVTPRFSRRPRIMSWPMDSSLPDPESHPYSSSDNRTEKRKQRRVGYSLAAAAMLPAIFVQVPSGLAAGGSLLAGITSANQITGNTTASVQTGASTIGNLDGTAFNVLFSVIQVAIGISVGLFMSALIVYPLGKRRSGLFSF